MAASDDTNARVAKAKEDLKRRFGDALANAFSAAQAEFEYDISNWKDDLDEGYEGSAIIDEMSSRLHDVSGVTLQKVYARLRVHFGIDEEDLAAAITGLDELNFNVEEQDINTARAYFTAVPGFQGGKETKDKVFFQLEAIARKNNVPILPLLNDLYQYWKVHTTKKGDKGVNQWVADSEYLSKKLDKNKQESIIGGINSYNHRVLPAPSFPATKKVHDSLSEFAEIIFNTTESIKSLIEKSDVLPIQIDLWIIPKNAHRMEMNMVMAGLPDDDDDDEDDEEEDDDDEKSDDDEGDGNPVVDLGDIAKLLQKDQCKFVRDTVSTKQTANCIRTMRQNIDAIVGNERHARLCMIVDRRHKKDEHDLFVYRPPKPFNAIPKEYVLEELLNNTRNYMVPNPDDPEMPKGKDTIDLNDGRLRIGGTTTTTAREFVVSFYVHSMDKIDAYLWCHGGGIRFTSDDILSVLPEMYFTKKSNDLAKNKIDAECVKKRFKIRCKDVWFEQWNKLINAKLFK